MSRLVVVPDLGAPVDLSYVEPSGWSSRPEHCADPGEAERLRRATDVLAGPAARERRRWLFAPCTCPSGVQR